MADTKISDLSDGGSIRPADALIVARAGNNKKIVASSLDWISDEADTWTYASADAPTFTFTVPGDKTGELTVGKRVKLTQTTVKYFIVTACAYSSGTTTVTIYGGTDYTLANAAISANYHSGLKAPAGFPLDPAKWTVERTGGSSSSDSAQANPVNNTWYNLGGNIVLPIGCWRVYYHVVLGIQNTGSDSGIEAYCTFSTANNSESDDTMTGFVNTSDASAAGKGIYASQHREKHLTLAAKATYYLNAMSDSGGTNLAINGTLGATVIRAVCAYL